MQRNSSTFSLLGALMLLAGTAAYLAPHNQYFVPNFALYWLPAVLVLIAGFALGAAPTVTAGSSIALAAFVAAFHSWVASMGRGGDLAWLGYLFAMPGAFVGLLTATWLARSKTHGVLDCLLIALAATIVGLALNMGILCNTLMYCH